MVQFVVCQFVLTTLFKKKNAKFTDLLSSVVMLCVVFTCIDYSRSGVL